MAKPTTNALKQRIADLERELRLKDERIRELKDEIDDGRDLVRRYEEHHTWRPSSPHSG